MVSPTVVIITAVVLGFIIVASISYSGKFVWKYIILAGINKRFVNIFYMA